ncbi:sodium:proton antiporter (plasmid) [Burkholderia sp. SFA1]|nr:sodium:proton antiporter [Burkholderia sp. SFA1]
MGMDSDMTSAHWYLLLGSLLVALVLSRGLLARLLLSSATIYLIFGFIVSLIVRHGNSLNPMHHAELLGRIAEVALLISLFTVGLRMGVPILDRRWFVPLRLAVFSMAITVGLITAIGVWGLQLPVGAAILLGGILAPTDPVLASGVQTERGQDPDRLGFNLAGEGALNDATSFPLVTLGLAMLPKGGLAHLSVWHWMIWDVFWSSGAGIVLGALIGAVVGHVVVYLRTRHEQAVGLDEFLALGVIGMAYGVAQLCDASGFLAVFAAGLAFQRVQDLPRRGTVPLGAASGAVGHEYETLATHSHHASEVMGDAVRNFNAQLEHLAELTVVIIIGALLPGAAPVGALWWFIPTVLLLVRPAAVASGALGMATITRTGAMMAWFGIRGIGSMFYLMYAINHGLSDSLSRLFVALTLGVISASIVLHGASVRPMMRWYDRSLSGLRR